MPTTYNGIGTHYYGKRNVEHRPDTCRSCGRQVTLESYDTRLWFVVIFIPLIPIARKRIIDDCPACRRHYAMDADKWDAARQLNVSGAMEKFRENPTPEAAMEAHQQLLTYHQMTQAAEFRQLIAAQFADNAKLQAYLGEVLAHFGRTVEAAPFYDRALALRPDLPEARSGVALKHLRENRLDEARGLLDFLEKPGASQLYSVAPLELLANALQGAGRHEEALDLYGKLLAEVPAAAEVNSFRKQIGKSEKALARRESILPKRRFRFRKLFTGSAVPGAPNHARTVTVAAAILALLCFGMAIGNEWIRRHRTLHIVNGFDQPATVEIIGAGSVTVGGAPGELRLPEGHYHAKISGPVREEFDFQIASDYFDRWFADPAWVINVGGRSILMLTEARYRARNPVPPVFRFFFGENFASFSKVTHLFKELPESISMKSRERERALTELSVFGGKPSSVLVPLQLAGRDEEMLRLCEWGLGFEPDDETLVNSYVTVATKLKQQERAERFLEKGLTRRPVAVQWHRMYQGVRSDSARESRLRQQYDLFTTQEPGNADLCYLRGRIGASSGEAHRWFEKARAADPEHIWALFALGYGRASVGDWMGARPLLARAAELRPENNDFTTMLFETRLALGETAALESELRGRLQRKPHDIDATTRLCLLLAATHRNSEALAQLTAVERQFAELKMDTALPYLEQLRYDVLYAVADFEGLVKAARVKAGPTDRAPLFRARLEQGQIAEAVRLYPDTGEFDAYTLLTVSLAWGLAGNRAEADLWQGRAVHAFESTGEDGRRAATLLTASAPPSKAEIGELYLASKAKAIVLAALARRHAGKCAELSAAARQLNITPTFPFHLVQRATAPAS